ncbi:hypothetical protein EV426DRAFT_686165 [Tirmania nivea]|nr:hypothetical protein EV426DRAFT_686165 [Tirmania nivea]
MARVMDRKTVDAELKEIAQKKVEAAAAEKAKLARKKEAAAKIIKEQAIQKKKATPEASWRLEQDKARAEHRKPPRKPVKPPRPNLKAVGIGSADSAEEGAEDLEQAGNTIIEAVQDIEAIDDQDAEELADMVWELEITEFSNMSIFDSIGIQFIRCIEVVYQTQHSGMFIATGVVDMDHHGSELGQKLYSKGSWLEGLATLH